jgi:diguanylate cyclase (GGDEF)-like protein/PAS domain S-box-containing protein
MNNMEVPARRGLRPSFYVLMALIPVTLLLVLFFLVRMHDFEQRHTSIAEATVQVLEGEIQRLLDEQKRQVALFVKHYAHLINALAADPDSEDLELEIKTELQEHFPDYFAFSLANGNGAPLLEDFDGYVAEVCIQDMKRLASQGSYDIGIHPNNYSHHYDIMVTTGINGDPGIFFVSFRPSALQKLLNATQPRQHQLMLINSERAGLIEVTPHGARDHLNRDSLFLTKEEWSRVQAVQPLAHTQWKIADLLAPGIHSEHLQNTLKQSLTLLGFFTIATLWVFHHLRRGERFRRQAAEQLRRSNSRLERLVSRRTAALKKSKELAEITLTSISDGVITTDSRGTVRSMNPVAEQLTSWAADDARGRSVTEILHFTEDDGGKPLENPVFRCVQEQKVIGTGEKPLVSSRNGKPLLIQCTASPIRNFRSIIQGVVLVIRDVTEEQLLTRKLSWQASHDSLTGLINRLQFERRLKNTLTLAHSENSANALLFLDLDRFKLINDSCGHNAGDEALRQLADLLRNVIRRQDTLARLGGDEFGLLLEACPEKQALEVADSLRSAVADYRFIWQGKTFSLGVSIGLVPFGAEYSDISTLMRHADSACYAAKESGRDRVHIYRENDREISRRQGDMLWVPRLHDALDHDHFRLYCQRIHPLQDHRIPGQHFEILLRLEPPEGPVVTPGAFIPAAERFNLMPSIDRMVFDKAFSTLGKVCTDCASFGYFSINLSAHTLNDKTFIEFLEQRLKESGADPSRICIELPESVVTSNFNRSATFIQHTKQMGFKLALDHFGTSISSFTYLKNLDIDFLKISAEFISNLVNSPVDRVMLKSVHDIAEAMGASTIAEHVENEEILISLKEMGLDYAQGPIIATPQPLDRLMEEFYLRCAPCDQASC